ncbi:MAG: hypothetical protein GY810_14530 [Aureispira sp.]|nr:hypothetical protein [Aureispira sp.]
MPTFRIGTLIQFDSERIRRGLAWYDTFFLTIEGGVKYMPFSFDLDEHKGQSALAFPVQVGTLIPLYGAALTIGAGAQFSRTEFNRNRGVYKDLKNPFFVTYFIEFGVVPHSIDAGYSFFGGVNFFSRVGFGNNETMTIDLGVRGFLTFAPEGY